MKYNFLESTAMVYIVSVKDGSSELCTATAFSKNGQKYQFFTAAHCVADYDEKTSETVLSKSVIFLNLEKPDGEKVAYKAKVLAIGEIKNFEDFAILEAEIDRDRSIMPLSESDPELDEDVRIVTTPLRLLSAGFLQFRGYVSREKMDNMTLFEVKTKGAFGIQVIGLGTGFGASGAGVFSVKRGEVVGVVIGNAYNQQGHVTAIVSPITKFNNFYKEYKEGKRPLVDHKQIDHKQIGPEP
ncbi:MAG: serine protease [Patescibacteria group bacterium]